jgi:16S rRNA (cytosine967-C5)-methyltransferase
MKGKFDWIYLDLPCTGTGTYRRNPDAKFRFSVDKLNHMINLQRGVF